MNVILLCHAATHAIKAARFPTGIEPAARDERAALADRFAAQNYAVISSPAAVARETASWLASEFDIDPAFDDIDYGRWRGHEIRAIAQQDPKGVASWLADMHARPHGGESIAMLAERVGEALQRMAADASHERCIVVTHAVVVKAALSHVRAEPLSSLVKIDLAPLSAIWLQYDASRGAWSERNFDSTERLKRIDST